MALNRIILWLGNSLLGLCGLMIISSLMGFAITIENPAYPIAMGISGGICGLLGFVLVFVTRRMQARESFSEALMFLVFFWLFIPVFAAIPYLTLGVSDTYIAAYFEAVSAFTTTGASAIDLPSLDDLAMHYSERQQSYSEVPMTILIYRSILQWSGGVIVATFAVVILAALNLQGTGVHRSVLFTFRKGELFKHLANVVKVIAAIYLAISAICFIFLLLSGTTIFNAFCLSMTSVSTGGLTSVENPIADYVGNLGLIVLCVACLLGAFNVAVLWDIVRNVSWGDLRRLFFNVEHRALFVLTGLLIILAGVYTDFHHMTTVIPEAVFFATSTGYDYHVIGVEMVPPVVLIALALVGGSALSTTGGVKLIRVLLLFKHLDTDMDRLTHPSRVVPVIFRSQPLPDKAFLSLWMYFFGYTLVFAAGIMALAMTGMEFPVAVAGSAASVSNMGPLLPATLPNYDYGSYTGAQMLISSVLMLIGRVEVLAAFAFLSPRIWTS